MKRLFLMLFVISVSTSVFAQEVKKTQQKRGGIGKREPFQDIHVLEERFYLKEGKFEIAPFFGTSWGDKYISHKIVGIKGLYHFREKMAVSILGSFFFSKQTNFTMDLRNKASLLPSYPKLEELKYMFIGALDLNPIYGKFKMYNIFGQFDVYVSAGVGMASTKWWPYKTGESNQKIYNDLGIKMIGSIAGGFRIWMFEKHWLTILFEVRDIGFADAFKPSESADFKDKNAYNDLSDSEKDKYIGDNMNDSRNIVMFLLGFSILM